MSTPGKKNPLTNTGKSGVRGQVQPRKVVQPRPSKDKPKGEKK